MALGGARRSGSEHDDDDAGQRDRQPRRPVGLLLLRRGRRSVRLVIVLLGLRGCRAGVDFVSAGRVVTVEKRATIVRDATTLEALRRLPAAPHVTAVASVAGGVAFGARDGSVHLLDLGTGVLRPAAGRHEGSVVAMAFSPRGDRLVTAGDDERLIVWDVRNANAVEAIATRGIGLVEDLAASRVDRFLPARGRAVATALAPDGGTLAMTTAGGTVELWDVASRRRLLEPQIAHAYGTSTAGRRRGASCRAWGPT